VSSGYWDDEIKERNMKFLLISLLLFPIHGLSQLRIAKIFSDEMVLQRDMPVKIWGQGIPGKRVTVTLKDQSASTVVKGDSSWLIQLKKQNASSRGIDLVIACENEQRVIRNILFGDIWLCIGQSNMQWPLKLEKHYREEIASANQPLIRLYNPSYAGQDIYNAPFNDSVINRLNPGRFYEGQWSQCDTSTAKNMSAVAYYFGKSIAASEQVPIGLINLAIGGAPIETFVRKDALERHAKFKPKVKGDWLNNASLPAWARERGLQNTARQKNVRTDDLGPNHGFKPGFAYAAGISPITQLPIKGIIWYQGESSAEEIERVREYGELQKLMVSDYRLQWKQINMPFYWVQLSAIERALWPEFRDEQRKLLKEIPYSGMAVSSDIGDRTNVHPTNKKFVGDRLARWALHTTYGRKNVLPSGPLPSGAKYRKGEITIEFEFAGVGLTTQDGKPLQGFSIDGENEIKAKMKNKRVIISVSEKPAFVYYGWKPFTDANLVNEEGLPASTFKINVQ
jgi:sialate O-acetylesterase